MAAASQRLGELFATGSSDGKLRLIDAATGDVGREVLNGDAPLLGGAFHPNGDVIKKTKKAEPGEDFDDEILTAAIHHAKGQGLCKKGGSIVALHRIGAASVIKIVNVP